MSLRTIVWGLVVLLAAAVIIEIYAAKHMHERPPAAHLAAITVAPSAEDDDPSCLDYLDSLSPKEAADCMQPSVSRVIALVEDHPGSEEDGPIQLLIFIGKEGNTVSYNREELLASPGLQLLLKRLVKLKLVDKEWFIPTLPDDGTCT